MVEFSLWKKIMAVLATIAAVLGFGFATNTAMADDAVQRLLTAAPPLL